MIENMISKFTSQNGINVFSRIDDKHILDLYVGFDNNSNYSILLISEIEPNKLVSSQIIQIDTFERKDSKWATIISLTQLQYLDLFYQVCFDLIESSRGHQNTITAQSFFFERFKKWQNLLKRNKKGLLNQSEIKGLIGELFFIKNVLMGVLPSKTVLDSWTGTERTKQDFILANNWFEIKAITSSSDSVKISSIEQLDIIKKGYLVLISLDRTSSLDQEKITLNKLYDEISTLLEGEQLRLEFDNKLFEFGYINRKEYDEEVFRFMGIDYFYVDSTFPSLRKEFLPNEIIEANYQISISGIERYHINDSKQLEEIWN